MFIICSCRERERERRSRAVRWLTVGELCDISRGRVISKIDIQEHSGPYPVYSSQTENNGILGYISTFDYSGAYLTWTTDGANAGTVFYRQGNFSITNVCGLLKPRTDLIDIRYLYFALSVLAKKHVSSGMGNPKLMSNVMSRIRVPVPSIKEQKEIAALLDRFEAICNDMNAGIPAEVEARKKQYEYYRDKLLTFKEAV